MADDTHETITDIIAEMRHIGRFNDWRKALLSWADRLEAALKREKAAIEADALAVGGIVEAERKRERGDHAKLREAMLSIKADILKRRSENAWYVSDSGILERIDAALAAAGQKEGETK